MSSDTLADLPHDAAKLHPSKTDDNIKPCIERDERDGAGYFFKESTISKSYENRDFYFAG